MVLNTSDPVIARAWDNFLFSLNDVPNKDFYFDAEGIKDQFITLCLSDFKCSYKEDFDTGDATVSFKNEKYLTLFLLQYS